MVHSTIRFTPTPTHTYIQTTNSTRPFRYLRQREQHDIANKGHVKEIQHDQAAGRHGRVVVPLGQDGDGLFGIFCCLVWWWAR